MLFDEIWDIVNPIDGWMPEPDCRTLYKYSKDIKGEIVEIGSYKGRSAVCLALSSPESTVTTIDIFADKKAKTKSEFIKNVYGLKIAHFFMPSVEVGKRWKTPIDLLHIDGDHTYKGIKSDLEAWIPHLKKGCYALLHDYNVNYGRNVKPDYLPDYGVRRVVDEEGHKYFDEIITDPEHHGFAICRKS